MKKNLSRSSWRYFVAPPLDVVVSMTFLTLHLPAVAVSLLYTLSFPLSLSLFSLSVSLSLSLSLILSVSQSVRGLRFCSADDFARVVREYRDTIVLYSSYTRASVYDTQRGAVSAVTHLRPYRMCIGVYIYTNACCIHRGSGHDDLTPADSPAEYCEKCRARTVSIGSDLAATTRARATKKVAHNNIIIYT